MNTADSNNKVKQVIGQAKAVPVPAYLLIVLNLIMLTAFVFQELPLHYVLGMVLFSVGLITFVGQILSQACGCIQTPASLISDRVQSRVRELSQKFTSYAKTLHADELQSKTINTVITILLIVYVGTILSTTVEIFLTVNILYCLVFLPEWTDSCCECYQKCIGDLLSKIRYQK